MKTKWLQFLIFLFGSIFADEECSSYQPSEGRMTSNVLDRITIDESDVLRVTENIKANKAHGHEKMSSRILQEVKY